MYLDCGASASERDSQLTPETRVISYEEVRRAAAANGLSVDDILALIAKANDRFLILGEGSDPALADPGMPDRS